MDLFLYNIDITEVDTLLLCVTFNKESEVYFSIFFQTNNSILSV